MPIGGDCWDGGRGGGREGVRGRRGGDGVRREERRGEGRRRRREEEEREGGGRWENTQLKIQSILPTASCTVLTSMMIITGMLKAQIK